ncbi:MAG TPA: SPOR domain-containing protein [Acidobacteriota bacterium]|nr:SPOR domain-containing protein [Acidobacteriota bacterium]
MKAKLSPRQAFTLYGVILGFVFAFYLIGLLIGRNYVGETAELSLPESVSEPVPDVAPMLDFYQQLERRETVSGGSRKSESTETSQSGSEPSGPQESSEDERIPDNNRSEIKSSESWAEEPGSFVSQTENQTENHDQTDESVVAPSDEPEARYTVQIGAFSTEQEARQVLLRLEAKSFPARLQAPRPGESPPYYRVWVGAFASPLEARRLEEQLKAESFPTYLKKLD